MALYNIVVFSAQVGGKYDEGPCEPSTPATLLRIGFGSPAQNDAIVLEVAARMAELKAQPGFGGGVVLVNGPASLPVTVVIGHALAHQFGVVGIFDPKVGGPGGGYVVALSHGGIYPVGAVIPASEVQEVTK
jgi:CRISPR-associated protein Csx3